MATAFQGQGFGGTLLRALIEESKQTGISLYLETETEANVRLYNHHGFEVVKAVMMWSAAFVQHKRGGLILALLSLLMLPVGGGFVPVGIKFTPSKGGRPM